MRKIILPLLAGLSMSAMATVANAAIIVTTSPVSTDENVLFNNTVFAPGNMSFTTDTNKTPGTNVTFIGNEALKTVANGQCCVTGADDGLTFLEFKATDPLIGFSVVEFNLNWNKQTSDPTTALLTFYDQFGAPTSEATGTLGNGQNRFGAYTTLDSVISRVTIQTGADLAYVEQVRLDAAQISAIPEPATWALMIVGFGMVGASIRRRGSRVVATA